MQEIIIKDFRLKVLNKPIYQERNQLIELYWTFHPRYKFFKVLPQYCTMLDAGANSGGLYYWKEWGLPLRTDIKMYALDLNKGKLFDKYEGYFIVNLDSSRIPVEDGYFNAVLASHVLEHLKNVDSFFFEINRILNVKGKVYIELPAYDTQGFPEKQAFVDKKVHVSITNFFDDKTHIKARTLDELANLCKANGFTVLERGLIENKFLEDELFTYGFQNQDSEITQYGVWLKLRWSQYLIAEKN